LIVKAVASLAVVPALIFLTNSVAGSRGSPAVSHCFPGLTISGRSASSRRAGAPISFPRVRPCRFPRSSAWVFPSGDQPARRTGYNIPRYFLQHLSVRGTSDTSPRSDFLSRRSLSVSRVLWGKAQPAHGKRASGSEPRQFWRNRMAVSARFLSCMRLAIADLPCHRAERSHGSLHA
jgi:hypothetical protein